MGMVVRSNIMAINANRQLGVNNSSVAKNLEKLSSGFKINRAGDDASGLAISEKMKAQIKGLETASANSQDGISLVQTAEGALTEVHDMLNRMTELATKSANGTIQDEVDREAIQSEVNALNDEIDRISKSTNFNGINLLDGSLSGKAGSSASSVGKIEGVTVADTTGVKGKYTGKTIASTMAKTEKAGSNFNYSVTYSEGGKENTVTFNITLGKNADGDYALFSDSGKEYAIADFAGAGVAATDIDAALAAEISSSSLAEKFTITAASGAAFAFEAKENGSAGAKIVSIGENTVDNSGKTTIKDQTITETTQARDVYKRAATGDFTLYKKDGSVKAGDAIFTVNGKKFMYAETGADISGIGKDVNIVFGASVDAADDDMAAVISKQTGLDVSIAAGDVAAAGISAKDMIIKSGTTSTAATGGLTLQIGDTGDDFNHVTVSVDDMSASGLGTNGLDVSSQDAAKASISTIKTAINTVSTNRADLGALQNRLEHTINNLDVAAENMSAANSRIRDTDMAKQMMEYTKMNVLTQAAQAMLAQANQQPQSILQLLQ